MMPLVALTNPWAVIMLRCSPEHSVAVRGIDVLFLVVCFLCALDVLHDGRIRQTALLLLSLIAALLMVSFVGGALVPGYRVDWPSLIRFAEVLSWGVLAVTLVRNQKVFAAIVWNIVLAGAVLASFSIYLGLTNHNLHRIAGFLSAAGSAGYGQQASFNEIGALFTLATLLALSLLSRQDMEFRRCVFPWALGGVLLNGAGLLLVQSRSAFFALAVGVVAIPASSLAKALLFGRLSKAVRQWLAIGMMLGVALLFVSFQYMTVNRLANTFGSGTSEQSSALARVPLWGEALQNWISSTGHFLFGGGFGSAKYVLGAASSHNFFLDISLSCGLVGLVCVMAFLIWPLRTLAQAGRRSLTRDAALAAVWTVLVVGFFGNTPVDPFYGGATFLLLYGALGAAQSDNRS
jgi:O-antigen ligase